jgi:hypothetical protein
MLPNVSDPATDYGLPKNNRDTQGPVDPTKELDYAEYERLATDMAANTHTAPRAWVYVTFAAGVPSVSTFDSVWGSAVAVKPSITDNGAGDTTLTWTAAKYDDLNPTPARRTTRAPAFRCAVATVAEATPRIISATWTANTVRVYTTTHAGVADDCNFVVVVY